MKESCGTCRFWKIRECRRYPPVLYESGATFWPDAEADGWCGEWQSSAVVPAKRAP